MDAYAYQAALYCEVCAERIKLNLNRAGVEDNGDSDNYPQGPYSQGGGEADTPQNCDECLVFLQNPLTPDGVEYVRQALREMPIVRLGEWREFYREVTHA